MSEHLGRGGRRWKVISSLSFREGGHRMKIGIAAAALIALGGLAAAQHQHGQMPYAGLEQRTIKALNDQQLSDLREGRGMGLALAAELNGYPGPLHVLELADQIELSGEQRERVRQLYDSMKAE